MAKVLQLRRGTTAQNDVFTGAEGEITVDTTKKTLRLHDGSTAGGKEIIGSSDLATVAKSGAYSDLSGKPTLSTVATSGSYNDLADKPSIPSAVTKTSQLTNDSGFLTSHQDISGKVNVSGARGALAGYETTTAGTTVSATSADALVAGTDVTVSNGAADTSWTKVVSLTAAVTVTLGSSWTWQGGSAPTIVANGILVCCWCGSFGLCSFVSPQEE